MPRVNRPRWLPAFLAGFVGVVAGALLRRRREGDTDALAPVVAPVVTPPLTSPQPLNDEELAAALGIHLPRPTVWPAVVGLGVTLALAGIVTSWAISALGIVALLWGLGGWIGDLRDEGKHGR